MSKTIDIYCPTCGRMEEVPRAFAAVPPPELAPQPPPANPPRGPAIWPMVIAEAEEGGEDPRLIALFRARHEQGIAKYGVALSAHDGRNTTIDALQESLDLVVYLRKKAQEQGVGDYWTSRALDAARLARSLLDDIEIETAR